MRRIPYLCLAAGLLASTFLGGARAQDPKAKETKVSVIKVTVPENALTTLVVRGDKGTPEKELKATGPVREFKTPPVEVGVRYEYTIEATIVPNNYTVIKRPRKLVFTGGRDAAIDMTREDKELDKIEVRFVATPADVVDEMAKLAKIGKDDVVYDLGCGDGVMLIRPVQLLGAKRGVGIDIDPKMVKESKDNVAKAGLADKIEIREGDILDLKEKDLADATVVLLYIGDDLGARLGPVLQKALKPGARVVSHRFKLGDWKPNQTKTFTAADGEEYVLHVWEVKAK